MKTLIQPYELLGVATNSTPKDVRKAYYQLALLCHPDKGGDPKDMRMLQTAYEWVMAQLSCVDTDYTYEQAQEEFDHFVASQNQEGNLPTLSEVMLEAHGLSTPKIRAWYEEKTLHISSDAKSNDHYQWFQQFLWREIHLSALRGSANHDTCLEKALREVDSAFASLSDPMNSASIAHGYGSYVSTDTPDVSFQPFPNRELIVYKEQQPFHFSSPKAPTFSDIQVPAKLDDYSTALGSVQGYDYSLAFTDQSPCLEKELEGICATFTESVNIAERLEKLEKERELTQKDVATCGGQNRCEVMFGSYPMD